VCRAGLLAKADASSKVHLSGVLSVAVKAVTVTGLLAVTLGPPYSFTLLRTVYSQRWADTEAPFVLGCYTAYLLLLAVNGEPVCAAASHACPKNKECSNMKGMYVACTFQGVMQAASVSARYQQQPFVLVTC
jgi:hypothetical protein